MQNRNIDRIVGIFFITFVIYCLKLFFIICVFFLFHIILSLYFLYFRNATQERKKKRKLENGI